MTMPPKDMTDAELNMAAVFGVDHVIACRDADKLRALADALERTGLTLNPCGLCGMSLVGGFEGWEKHKGSTPSELRAMANIVGTRAVLR